MQTIQQTYSKRLALKKSFTLVELMVAMSLGVILTGAIVFIFIQSQKIFTDMDAKVTVYQYARSAFDIIERDLANATKTIDMEFYQDSQTKGISGHYDVQSGDPEAIPVRDFNQRPHFLYNQSEKFIYAMMLNQPPAYKDFAGREHRRDSLYFRTVATINGQTRPMLVEYALDYQNRNGTLRRLPRLVRRHWSITKIDNSGLGGIPNIELNGANQVPGRGPNEPHESELCLYVTDVQIEFYMRDKRSGRPGRFFNARQAIEGLQSKNPQNDPRLLMRNLSREAGGYTISCYYEDRNILNQGGQEPLIFDRQNRVFRTNGNFFFHMCQPGDELLIFNSDVAGLKARDLTIKAIEKLPKTPGQSEDRWGIRVNEEMPSNLPRDPRLSFRTGWLPPMVRVTLKIKDERARAVRTMVRQFKLLGA